MRQSTDTYEHTINGLLQKRQEILHEMAVARERLGLLTNDIEAIDRILERLGFNGPLEKQPISPRFVLFYRGQLREWLLTQLRDHGPATTRQLADRLVKIQNNDATDRRLMGDLVNRVGKSLRHMQSARAVRGEQAANRGENLWHLAQA